MPTDITPLRRVISERVTFKSEEKPEQAKKMPDLPVGIFDSGVGGLTVLSEFIKQLSHEDVIYLADTARVPYGGRPEEEIIEINKEVMHYFVERGAKMVIMACGTSSSLAYPKIKDDYKFPIVSLIEPGARSAVEATKNGKIGVIATVGTVRSEAFQKKIKELNKEAEVYAEACPLFVPLIEGGFIESQETIKVAREYLKPLLQAGIDTLILGCTHYPHLRKILEEISGPNVTLIDPALEAMADAKKILSKNKMLKSRTGKAKYEFVVTGSPLQFKELGSKLLGKPIPKVNQIKL